DRHLGRAGHRLLHAVPPRLPGHHARLRRDAPRLRRACRGGPAPAEVRAMMHHAFFVHALLAGTGIAAAAGLAGYFLVLRAQVFTGDALSHVAFTGALAALAFGVDLHLGLYAATVGVAVLIGLLGRRG